MSKWYKASEIERLKNLTPRDGIAGLPDNHVITVSERTIKIDERELVQNNVSTDTYTLELDAEWDDITPVVIFSNSEGDYKVAYENGPTKIPAAVMAVIGAVDVSVFGLDSTGAVRVVTKAAPNIMNVVESGKFVGEVSEDDISLLGQILAAVEAANEAAENANATIIKSAVATTLTPGEPATANLADNVLTIGVPKGEKGEKGEKGDKGDPGTAATIAVGSVTGLDAGASPTVVNSGTSNAARFDFGIPKGDKGDTGVPGHTPQRGVDYWTAEDRKPIEDATAAARDAASFTGPMDDAISGRVLGNTTVKMDYWTYHAWNDKRFLIGSNGEVSIPSKGFSTTDFIACVPGENICYRSIGIYQNAASLCFYDAEKNFIEAHGYNIGQLDTETVYEETLTVPENVRFLRFCSTNVYHSAIEGRIASQGKFRSYLALSSPSEMIESLQAEADKAGMDGTVYYEDETEDVTSEFYVKSGKYVDESGSIFDLSGTPSYYIDPITLEEADGLLVTAKSMYGARAFFILDKNRYILYVSEANISWVDHEISKADILRNYPDAEYVILASFDQNLILKRRKSVGMQDKVSEIANSNKVPEYTLPGSIVEVDTGEEVGYVSVTSGAVNHQGKEYLSSGYVELAKHQSIVAVVSYGWDAAGCVLYDSNKSLVKVLYKNPNDAVTTVLHLDTKSLTEMNPTAVYARFSGDSSGKYRLKVGVSETTDSIENGISFALRTGNVLYGKKYAACGDSFTEALNLGDAGFDPFTQSYKSYAWLIANRNGMELYDDGLSGSTITVTNPSDPTERNPFSHQRYKEVPADADYITLMFGLNETSLASSPDTLGTRDSTENTTVWGAWNTVLEYLIENHPTARIGIIISDAWMNDSYANALKEIAEWWGIPTLDLGGDPSVPLMNSGRRSSSGLELNPKVRDLRDRTFYNSYDGSDSHPNAVGHEWRSTVVENWMRGL